MQFIFRFLYRPLFGQYTECIAKLVELGFSFLVGEQAGVDLMLAMRDELLLSFLRLGFFEVPVSFTLKTRLYIYTQLP